MQRRHFLKSTTAAAMTAAVLQPRLFAAGNDARLRVALIGTGWYGKTDLLHLMQVAEVDVVGLCDVDQQMLAEAAELVSRRQPSGKKPPTFGDYRQLLEAEKPEVVLVATPDHWHCLPMIEACRQGADVYVQKPLSYDVVEGQAMVAAARKYGSTVQVGLQRRSTPHLKEARERFIDSGKLGTIARVEIHSYYGPPAEFPAVAAPPAHLDWETYVGPAAWRDYNPGIHPRSWRACREFSNGQTGDLCVHFLDYVRGCLQLGWPTTIAAAGGQYQRTADSLVNVHDTQTATFDYGDLQVVWDQRNWGENPHPEYPWGAIFYGDKGTLKVSVRSYDFIPHGDGSPVHGEHLDERDKYPEDLEHKPTELFAAPATRRHLEDFLTARQEQRKPLVDIEQGHISSACCIMANLSMELGRSLRWDADRERVVDDDEANARLARPYRGDWQHPTPDAV